MKNLEFEKIDLNEVLVSGGTKHCTTYSNHNGHTGHDSYDDETGKVIRVPAPVYV